MSVQPLREDPPSDRIVALLHQRAEQLRGAPVAQDGTVLLPIAEFRSGSELFAIALADLRAVVPVRTVTPVPLSAPHVVGILRFQGQLLSALSLSALLGVKGWDQDPAVLLVVGQDDGRLCAIDCEQIPKPGVLSVALIEQARAAHGKSDEPVMKIVSADGTVRHLLDLAALIRRVGGKP